MKLNRILSIGVLVFSAAYASADNGTTTDSIATSQISNIATGSIADKRDGSQPTPALSAPNAAPIKKAYSKRKRGSRQTPPEPEYPTAVDNSQKLLAEADSLSMLFNPYKTKRVMYLPIVFFEYKNTPEMQIDTAKIAIDSIKPTEQLCYDKRWLEQADWDSEFENYHINHIITHQPWLVPYNISMLPEPPKKYEVKPDISKSILVIEEREVELPRQAPKTELKIYNWIHQFDASLQFSQAYLSENWYQGGQNNVNMIASAVYNLKLNQAVFPNKLFELNAQYKLGMNSAPEDELRDYSINEDLFQVNMKFGLKATKKFYYSMNMQFKTQLFQNFQTNTYDLSASFLTPGELNAGVGMTYSTANERKTFTFDASLSPVSYNLKICRAIDKMDPTTLGIDPGKHFGHEVGSSGECKLTWIPTPAISVSSRLFVFSNYQYLQGDLETTLNFSINKFLSTQIYAHLRYDDSAALDSTWRYWQFKEILSFGLQYKFRM